MSGNGRGSFRTPSGTSDSPSEFAAFLASLGPPAVPIPGEAPTTDKSKSDFLDYDLPDDSGPSRMVFPSMGFFPPPGNHATSGSAKQEKLENDDAGLSKVVIPSAGLLDEYNEELPEGKKLKSESEDAIGDTSQAASVPAAESGNVSSPTKDEEEKVEQEQSKEEVEETKLPSYEELLREEQLDAEQENETEDDTTEAEEPKPSKEELDEAFSALMDEVNRLPKQPKAGTGVQRRSVPAGGSIVQNLGTGEQQVIRLTSQFFPSPWQTLLLSPETSDDQMKKQFRKISLLIHPDKCKHPKANEAFQILTKAYEDLQKPEMREKYKQVIEEAKARLAKQREKDNKKRAHDKKGPLQEDESKTQVEIAEMCEVMLKERQEARQYAEECIKANERYEKEQEQKLVEEEERIEKERQEFRKGQASRVTSWRTFKTDVEDKSVKLLAFQGLRHIREQRKEVPGQAHTLKRKRPVGIDESYKDNWR